MPFRPVFAALAAATILWPAADAPAAPFDGDGRGEGDAAWVVLAADVRDGLPKQDGPNAVVCTNATEGDAWDAVAQKLAKVQQAPIWRFTGRDFTTLADRFRAEGPAHVTFVLPPQTIDVNFQWALLPWCAQLDADPFTDFRYGFVTGGTPAEAMAFVQRIAATRHTPMAKRMVEFGPTKRSWIAAQQKPWLRGMDCYRVGHNGNAELLQNAARFRGAGLVRFWGHGAPERIVDSATVPDVARLPIENAVVLGGACYTGVVCRTFDRTLGSKTVQVRDLAPEQSFCLALLRRGVRSYLGALDPDHGVTSLQETAHLFATAEPIGDAMKHGYDLLPMALRGQPWPLAPYPAAGTARPRYPVQQIMQRGAACRVLFGDPADRPLAEPVTDATVAATWNDDHTRLACRVQNQRQPAPLFHLFQSGFKTKGLLNNKIAVVVDVPEAWTTVPTPTGVTVRNDEGPVPHTLPTVAVEMWQGRRRLHVQVQVPQGIAYKPGLAMEVAFGGPAAKTTPPAKRTSAPARPAPPATPAPRRGTAPGAPTAAQPQAVAAAAGEWLLANATRSADGWSWAEYAGEDATHPSLYSGGAGTVMFLANLHLATGDARFKTAALEGARWLQGQAEAGAEGPVWTVTKTRRGKTFSSQPEGLYTGTAGIAWVLAELGVRFKQPALVAFARRAADGLCARARKDDGGWSWPGTGTDIIAGNAGIGCALLDLHRLLGRAEYLAAARGAATWLEAQAMTDGAHRTWSSHVGWTRHYPGFSHGTAGIVFFFTRLHRATKEARWLATARRGAEWLAAHAQTDGDGCKWFHYEPTATTSFRAGWCHGPAGTGLCLLALHDATGEAHWLELAERSARWVAKHSRLDADKPWFYSPSRCCGAAGIAEYYLALHRRTGTAAHLARARQVAAGLRALAYDDDAGRLRWTNYGRPDTAGKIYYGTSLQLGAAGAGEAFLGLAEAERRAAGGTAARRPFIVTPDRRW